MMALQTLTLELDGITAGDYLTWCRDPEPPALDYGLRSISIDADSLGDTITAVLDWDRPAPPARIAAEAAGLPPTADVRTCRSEHTAPPLKIASPPRSLTRDRREGSPSAGGGGRERISREPLAARASCQ